MRIEHDAHNTVTKETEHKCKRHTPIFHVLRLEVRDDRTDELRIEHVIAYKKELPYWTAELIALCPFCGERFDNKPSE